MKELVEFLATSLVDDKDSVRVDESVSERKVLYSLSVKQDDLGKVIGKKGRTVKAMRVLLSALAVSQGHQVSLQVLEPEKADADPSEDSDEEGSQENAEPDAKVEVQDDVKEPVAAQDESDATDAQSESEVVQKN